MEEGKYCSCIVHSSFWTAIYGPLLLLLSKQWKLQPKPIYWHQESFFEWTKKIRLEKSSSIKFYYIWNILSLRDSTNGDVSRLVIERAEPCRFWGILNPKLRGLKKPPCDYDEQTHRYRLWFCVQNIKCVMGFSNKDSLYIDIQFWKPWE